MSGYRENARQLVAHLDALSKERELTEVESLLLERSMCIADERRIPSGLTRDLARHGVRRDMTVFRARKL